jgi:hypothetical protein
VVMTLIGMAITMLAVHGGCGAVTEKFLVGLEGNSHGKHHTQSCEQFVAETTTAAPLLPSSILQRTIMGPPLGP